MSSNEFHQFLDIILAAAAVLSVLWAGIALPGKIAELKAAVRTNAERIQALEISRATSEARLCALADSVLRIERKLDDLLERLSSAGALQHGG